MDVTQAGTVYTVKAIPYNEFAYVNRFNYPKDSRNTVTRWQRDCQTCFKTLEALLNKQNEDEKDTGLVEKPDVYTVTFDSKGIEDTFITTENLEQQGMATQGVTGADGGFYVAVRYRDTT